MNKTKELLEKYKNEISNILKCDPKDIKFYIEQKINAGTAKERLEFKEIGELFYNKPDWEDADPKLQEIYRNNTLTSLWGLGKIEVRQVINTAEFTISSWKLYEMPHCCAFMISCNVIVRPTYANKNIGTILNLLRIEIGKLLNYSAILCTDIAQNTKQRAILAKNGWKDVYNVKNKRTNNIVFLSIKDIN